MPTHRLILTPSTTVIAEFDADNVTQAVSRGSQAAVKYKEEHSVSRGRDFQIQRSEGDDWVMVLGWSGWSA